MVAMEALIRASDVTLPSFTGTLRSARMNTRLAFKIKVGDFNDRHGKLHVLRQKEVR